MWTFEISKLRNSEALKLCNFETKKPRTKKARNFETFLFSIKGNPLPVDIPTPTFGLDRAIGIVFLIDLSIERATSLYFTKHFKTQIVVFGGFSKCCNWDSTPLNRSFKGSQFEGASKAFENIIYRKAFWRRMKNIEKVFKIKAFWRRMESIWKGHVMKGMLKANETCSKGHLKEGSSKAHEKPAKKSHNGGEFEGAWKTIEKNNYWKALPRRMKRIWKGQLQEGISKAHEKPLKKSSKESHVEGAWKAFEKVI